MNRKTVLSTGIASITTVALLGITTVVTNGFSFLIDPSSDLAYAASDKKKSEKKRCNNRKVEDGLCSVGYSKNASDATWLLWGDSHAAAIMPGVIIYLQNNKATGVTATKDGCAPLLGIKRSGPRFDNSCVKFNQNVAELLKNSPEIDTVILHARWAFSAEGTRFGAEKGQDVQLEDVRDEVTGGKNIDYFSAGLERTVSLITDAGKKVILIGGVPEIGWQVPKALGRNRRLGTPIPKAPTYEEIAARNHRANREMIDMAKRDGVIFIDPTSRLCDPDCAIRVEDRPFYVDEDHIGRLAAQTFVPPLIERAVSDLNAPGTSGGNAAEPTLPKEGHSSGE